jgi:hypothetical protein
MKIESKDESWCWKLGGGGGGRVSTNMKTFGQNITKGSQRPSKCPLISMCFYMLHIFVQNLLKKGRGKGRCVTNDIAIIIANITFLVQGQSKIK